MSDIATMTLLGIQLIYWLLFLLGAIGLWAAFKWWNRQDANSIVGITVRILFAITAIVGVAGMLGYDVIGTVVDWVHQFVDFGLI